MLLSYKKRIKAFTATWMNLERIILSEVSQTQTDKYHITYMWNLKKPPKDTNSTYLQNRNRPTDRKQTYGYQRGKGEEGKIYRSLELLDTHYYI